MSVWRLADYPCLPVRLRVGLIVLFSSMSALGYTALGDNLSANIINSLPDGDFRKISQLAFTISLITATYTLINPVFRQVEGPLRIEGPGTGAARCRILYTKMGSVWDVFYPTHPLPNCNGLHIA